MRARCLDPASLVTVFSADPDVHLYGLPDLEEPYWSISTWWRDGDAVVGLVGFPGARTVTAYAMSADAPGPSLDLLASLVGDLPDGTLVTGPTGLADRIRGERLINDMGVHWRLIHDGRSVATPSEVVRLSNDDLDDVHALHDTDPGAAFFLPHMLESGYFVGVRREGGLLASAGTHVASERYGVAAVGAVITDPAERGRGLGAAVTEGLIALLAPRFRTIGLNVADDNPAALRLYENLGFVRRFPYEEIELL